MAVRIRLSDGATFVVQDPFEQMQASVRAAIESGLLLEVRNGDGKLRSINPRQISFIEEADDDSLTPSEEKILQAVERRRGAQQP
jgi:hypothetical protein